MIVLAGCLPAGEEDTPADEPTNDTPDPVLTDHRITGSVGDGPVVDATITVRDSSDSVLDTMSSSSTADFDVTVKTRGSSYPLSLTAVGGTDLVTMTTPDFTLRSAVLKPGNRTVSNMNPFTTVAIEMARDMSGGLTDNNIEAALATVSRELNSGLTTLTGSGTMTTEVGAGNIAELIRASEALGEVVRRVRDNLASAGISMSGDAIVGALGSDLVDQVIDGRGGPRADARIAAMTGIVMAQVSIETVQNRLQVQGSDAMIRLDSALAQVFQGTPSPALDALPATAEMIDAARVGVVAANVLQPTPAFDNLLAELDGLAAGTMPATARQQLATDGSNAFVGTLSAIASASDLEIEAVNAVLRTGEAPLGNRAPVIGGSPRTSIEVGETFSFTPSASDPDGDELTFSISGLPTWASFEPGTGTISGTPQLADAGSNPGIVITVTDGEESASLPAFTLNVVEVFVNTPPTISGTPAVSVMVGDAFSFAPTAADADGDNLTFSISNRPAWASFDSGTGTLAGTPVASNVGSWTDIVISVSDGTDSASLPAFGIEVLPQPAQNNPPVISGTPASSVDAGSAYDFQPTASDPDGDALSFSISGRPSWASFDSATGRLSGTPLEADAGNFNDITITVTDGEASASLGPFSINVSSVAVNTPPEILGDPAGQVVVGSAYSFTPTASDADGDALTFSVSGLPSWASFDSANGRISGTPSAGDVGEYNDVSITVSDGEDNATLGPFSISVQNIVLGSATLTWSAPTQNTDGTPLTDLSGYRIYWGTSPGAYTQSVTINNPGVTTYVVENLAPGTYEFVSTAINAAGVESGYSNTATKVIN